MRVFGIIMLSVYFVLFIFWGVNCVRSEYCYEKEVGCYWNLAEKASTLKAKSEYIGKFVAALERCNLEGNHNAIWLRTPDNSFNENMKVLKTLQQRLEEIQTMDVQSFQYQAAIQQVTAQEQGEAHALILTLKQIWQQDRFYLNWSWVGIVVFLFLLAMMFIGAMLIVVGGAINDIGKIKYQ